MTVDPFLCFLGFIIFVMCCFWVDEHFFKPKRRTSPPMEKILNLVATRDGFKVHSGGYLVTEEVRGRMCVDWTLEDTVTGKLTWFYLYPMCGSVGVIGDLDWMNNYEEKRMYSVINSIGCAQDQAVADERKRKLELKHNAAREAAKKVYESR